MHDTYNPEKMTHTEARAKRTGEQKDRNILLSKDDSYKALMKRARAVLGGLLPGKNVHMKVNSCFSESECEDFLAYVVACSGTRLRYRWSGPLDHE
jgi:hypothetical protein